MANTSEYSSIPVSVNGDANRVGLPKFHRYPATMTQHLSNFVIKEFSEPGDFVLDPFCGSGNIPRTARVFGRSSIGVDLNPLAALISKVSLSKYKSEVAEDALEFVVKNIQNIQHNQEFAQENHLYYWFDSNVLDVIEGLKENINELSSKEGRDLLTLSLSSIIRSVSRADPKIFPPVYSKYMRIKYHPLKKETVVARFRNAAIVNIKKSQSNPSSEVSNGQAKIYRVNSLEFLRRDNKYYNLIFTSPPYAAAQKYVRSTSLELMTIFGMSRQQLVKLDRKDLGSEAVKKRDLSYADALPKSFNLDLPREYRAIYGRYLMKLGLLFNLIPRRLTSEGKFALVMGENSTAKGEIVPLLGIISSLAEENGLMIRKEFNDSIKKRNFSLKRYRATPIMKNEHIIILSLT